MKVFNNNKNTCILIDTLRNSNSDNIKLNSNYINVEWKAIAFVTGKSMTSVSFMWFSFIHGSPGAQTMW